MLKKLVREPLATFSKLTIKDRYLTVHNHHLYHINYYYIYIYKLINKLFILMSYIKFKM
jgi:hypothetical protein